MANLALNLERKAYSVGEVAEILGLKNRWAVYRLVRQGYLRAIPVGEKRMLIPVSAVEELLGKDKIGGKEECADGSGSQGVCGLEA